MKNEAGILALVAALGRLDATLLLSLTVLLAVGAALNSPAWAASVPLTVPRRWLTQALVLTSIGFNIARAIGPALGGLLLAVAGATAAFAANAVSFAFVVVVAGFLLAFPRTQTTIDVPPEPFRSAMRIGLAYALAEPVVRSTLVRSAAFFGCASAIWALLPLYVRQVLGLSSASFGLMMGVIGAGAVLGGLMMPQLHKLFSRNNLIMLAGASCSLALVPLAVIPGVMTAYAALLVFGIGWIVGASNLQATVQLATAPWVRSRSGAVSGGVQRRHGPGCDLLGCARRACGSARNDFRRGPWRRRDRAADASGAAPGRDRRSIGPCHIGSARAVDLGGDGAASAQRTASAAACDQLPRPPG